MILILEILVSVLFGELDPVTSPFQALLSQDLICS